MQIKLRFLGAAGNVTGSRHLVEVDGTRLLVDCGLYQERQFADRNWERFPVEPSTINAVVLTHAHLDHCGYLPKLVKEGFKGKIYCTQATYELAQIILLDAAKIQEEDAEHKLKRHKEEGREDEKPIVPLYTTEDAQNCFPYFSTVPYKQPVEISNSVQATLCDAGHILGSSIVKIRARRNGEERIIMFSGDVGRPNRPIIHDPTAFGDADYILVESTYGNRVHHDTEDIKNTMAEVINSTKKAGGKIIIPSFALERAQDVLYYLNELFIEERIPKMKIYLDSPMASRITKVFSNHKDMFDEQMQDRIKNHLSLFDMPELTFVATSEESKALNAIKETAIIIAGSGMCTAGRIKHHLANGIANKKNTIMFVGYQAVSTLGRRIVEGESPVRILGKEHNVKARIIKVNGFSGHADRNELLEWLKLMKTPPRKVFVVHGEPESAVDFSNFIKEETGWPVAIPEYNQEIVLD